MEFAIEFGGDPQDATVTFSGVADLPGFRRNNDRTTRRALSRSWPRIRGRSTTFSMRERIRAAPASVAASSGRARMRSAGCTGNGAPSDRRSLVVPVVEGARRSMAAVGRGQGAGLRGDGSGGPRFSERCACGCCSGRRTCGARVRGGGGSRSVARRGTRRGRCGRSARRRRSPSALAAAS